MSSENLAAPVNGRKTPVNGISAGRCFKKINCGDSVIGLDGNVSNHYTKGREGWGMELRS